MFNIHLMAASSIKRQFQESKLSNQQNREGRSLRSRPSFKSLGSKMGELI